MFSIFFVTLNLYPMWYISYVHVTYIHVLIYYTTRFSHKHYHQVLHVYYCSARDITL
jgi:hypothetical protein